MADAIPAIRIGSPLILSTKRSRVPLTGFPQPTYSKCFSGPRMWSTQMATKSSYSAVPFITGTHAMPALVKTDFQESSSSPARHPQQQCHKLRLKPAEFLDFSAYSAILRTAQKPIFFHRKEKKMSKNSFKSNEPVRPGRRYSHKPKRKNEFYPCYKKIG